MTKREIRPEVDGFEEKVGEITIESDGPGHQALSIEMAFTTEETEKGPFAHDELKEDLEAVMAKHA